MPPDSIAQDSGVNPLSFCSSRHFGKDYLKLPLMSVIDPGLSRCFISKLSMITSLTNFKSYMVIALCNTVLPIAFCYANGKPLTSVFSQMAESSFLALTAA